MGHDIIEENLDLGASRIAHMDAAGVDVQVLSFGSPGPQAFRCRCCDSHGARRQRSACTNATKTYPSASAGSPRLPTRRSRQGRAELERCVTKLGFKGAMIHSHQQGEFLDSPKYRVMWKKAEALGVPVYLHPALPHPLAVKAYFEGYEELARAPWGFAVDTSCHFLRLVFSGLFDDCPKLKIILGHLGEGIPFAMHRLDTHARARAERRGLEEGADRLLPK